MKSRKGDNPDNSVELKQFLDILEGGDITQLTFTLVDKKGKKEKFIIDTPVNIAIFKAIVKWKLNKK